MTPDLVADVGNTRVKWGLCRHARVSAMAALPPDDSESWQRQLAAWDVTDAAAWMIAGVHPQRRDQLADWARRRGDAVMVLDDWRLLGLDVPLDHPERVGIDRLLNAVALRLRKPWPAPAVLVSAGSAVTVDWVDGSGAFRGGAIFPGFRLMAKALHDYTALLPLIEEPRRAPPLPGTKTPEAIRAGVFWAAVGGIQALSHRLAGGPARVVLTGGDAPALATGLEGTVEVWPEMTLEGVRLTAAGLP